MHTPNLISRNIFQVSSTLSALTIVLQIFREMNFACTYVAVNQFHEVRDSFSASVENGESVLLS